MFEDIKEAQRELRDRMQEAFAAEFDKFFAENPGFDAVSWTQYTPGFNDGEPCVFRLGSVWVKPVGVPLDSSDPEYDSDLHKDEAGWKDGYWSSYRAKKGEMPEDVEDKLAWEMSQLLELLGITFGESSETTYSLKNGFKVDRSYDCGY